PKPPRPSVPSISNPGTVGSAAAEGPPPPPSGVTGDGGCSCGGGAPCRKHRGPGSTRRAPHDGQRIIRSGNRNRVLLKGGALWTKREEEDGAPGAQAGAAGGPVGQVGDETYETRAIERRLLPAQGAPPQAAASAPPLEEELAPGTLLGEWAVE